MNATATAQNILVCIFTCNSVGGMEKVNEFAANKKVGIHFVDAGTSKQIIEGLYLVFGGGP